LYEKYEHVRISGYSDSGYAGDKGDRKSTTEYCTFVGENLVTWRSKKQDVVSRSSAQAEYRVMTHTACEMMWLKNLIMELVLDSLDLCLCIVLINLQSILPKTLYYIRGPSTLRLTVI